MSRLYFLLLLGAIPLLADLRMSKCMRNHLKANQMATEEEEKQNLGEVFSINLSNVIEAMDGHCVTDRNVPDAYNDHCKTVSKDSLAKERSFLVDFNNGRLGNQVNDKQ